MKKLFIISLFIFLVLAANLFAQIDLTLVGGLNLSTVKFNDNNADNDIDLPMKSGFILGIETKGGPFIIGGSFIQRGMIMKGDDEYGGNITLTQTYNYLSGYLLYPISIQKQLSVFGGCQLGKFIGGTAERKWDGDSDSIDLETEKYALDFGILFGADFMFNSSVGVRGSYYIGLSNVIGIDEYPSNYNWKNRGIEISLLYKI